jgi:hypothetical protein
MQMRDPRIGSLPMVEEAKSKKSGPDSQAKFKGRRRSQLPFRQTDVERALRAAKATGGCAHVEIAPDGGIRIVLGETSPDTPEQILDQL